MAAVSVRDVRALLDAVDAIEYDSRRRAFEPDGLTALCGLLEADWVTYCELPRNEMRFSVDVSVGTRPFSGNTDVLEATFFAHRHEFPLHAAVPPADGVVLISDVATASAWRRTAF